MQVFWYNFRSDTKKETGGGGGREGGKKGGGRHREISLRPQLLAQTPCLDPASCPQVPEKGMSGHTQE